MKKFKKNILDMSISSIGFDLDNTLLDTDPYYINVKDLIFNDFVRINFPESEREIVKEKLDEIASARYKQRHLHGLKPTLIKDECKDTISESFPELVDERLKDILDTHTETFYQNSPPLLPGAKELLNFLSRSNSIRNLFGATDAQEDWSQIKSEYIIKNSKLDKFPYFSTDLKVRKNPFWWSSVFSKLNENPENILIIGDNYYADIYSSFSAGIKNAIWINRYNKSVEELRDYPIPEGVELITVKSIDEIIELWNNVM